MAALPRFDDVVALPAELESSVAAQSVGVVEHMNARDFYEFGVSSTRQVCESLGLDEKYRSTRGAAVFVAEHHIRYYGELRAGTRFTTHVRLLDRSSKALHMMSFLFDWSAQRIANTLEVTFVNADLVSRRAAAFAPDVAARIDQVIEQHRLLPWIAPTCGVMGADRDRNSHQPGCSRPSCLRP